MSSNSISSTSSTSSTSNFKIRAPSSSFSGRVNSISNNNNTSGVGANSSILKVNLFDTVGRFLEDDITQSIFDQLDNTLNGDCDTEYKSDQQEEQQEEQDQDQPQIELPQSDQLISPEINNNNNINNNINNSNLNVNNSKVNLNGSSNNIKKETKIQMIECDISNDDKDFDFKTIEVLDSLIDFSKASGSKIGFGNKNPEISSIIKRKRASVITSLDNNNFTNNIDNNNNSNNNNISNNNNNNNNIEENKINDPNDINSLISDIDSLVFDLTDIKDELEKSSIRMSTRASFISNNHLNITSDEDNNNNNNNNYDNNDLLPEVSPLQRQQQDTLESQQLISSTIDNLISSRHNSHLPQDILDIMSSFSFSPPKNSTTLGSSTSFIIPTKNNTTSTTTSTITPSTTTPLSSKKTKSSFISPLTSPKKIQPVTTQKPLNENQVKLDFINKRQSLKTSQTKVPNSPSPTTTNTTNTTQKQPFIPLSPSISEEFEDDKEDEVVMEKQPQPQQIEDDQTSEKCPSSPISAISPPSSPLQDESKNELKLSSSSSSSSSSQLQTLIQETIVSLPSLPSTTPSSPPQTNKSNKYQQSIQSKLSPKPTRNNNQTPPSSPPMSLSTSSLPPKQPITTSLPPKQPTSLPTSQQTSPVIQSQDSSTAFKWVVGNSRGKTNVSLSSSGTSIKTGGGNSGDDLLSDYSDSYSSGISSQSPSTTNSTLSSSTNSSGISGSAKAKLKNHIWRKSNMVGPGPVAIAPHPRSSTDPSKYSFGRESIVSLDSSNRLGQSTSSSTSTSSTNTGGVKHRSTFPGSINDLPISATITTTTSTLINSTTLTSSGTTIISSQPSISSPIRKYSGNKNSSHIISSPILTSTILLVSPPTPSTSILSFDENGMEKSSINDLNINSPPSSSRSLSKSGSNSSGNNTSSGNIKDNHNGPIKQRIDLENPSKVKKIKELLRNYRSKVITLINKVYRDAENILQRRKEFLSKYEKRNKEYISNHQFELSKLYREYYCQKILTKEMEIQLSREKIEFLKLKLIDIGNLIKLLEDYFYDGSSSSSSSSSNNYSSSGHISLTFGASAIPESLIKGSGNNNYSSIPSSMSPCSSTGSLPTIISLQKKNIIVYSSFFLKTDILLNKNNYILNTRKRLKYLYENVKKFKLNYKIYYFNIHQMENMEKREAGLKSILSRAKKSRDIPFLLPWDLNQDIQSEFAKIVWDCRFMEGKQIKQLINIISDDCTGARKIKPIDIEIFVEKFVEHLISSYHLVIKPIEPPTNTFQPTSISSVNRQNSFTSSSSSSQPQLPQQPNTLPSSNKTTNEFIANHNGCKNTNNNLIQQSQHQPILSIPPPSYEDLLEIYRREYQQTYETLSQLFKRGFYSEIYPLLKIILANEAGYATIKYDIELQNKVDQYKNQTLKDLNMLPSNFPDDYDWSFLYADGRNPFEQSISILNDLAFLTAPIDLVHTIQQSISSIYTTCNQILNGITFGNNFEKVLENSSLLNKFTRGGTAGGIGGRKLTTDYDEFNNGVAGAGAKSDSNISIASSSSSSENLSQFSIDGSIINHHPNHSNNHVHISDNNHMGIQSHPIIQQHQAAQQQAVQQQTINRNMPSHSLSADDLFPVFIYVVMNSDIICLSGLISSMIEHFSSELETSGEFGWCGVSFQAAISHLNNL